MSTVHWKAAASNQAASGPRSDAIVTGPGGPPPGVGPLEITHVRPSDSMYP